MALKVFNFKIVILVQDSFFRLNLDGVDISVKNNPNHFRFVHWVGYIGCEILSLTGIIQALRSILLTLMCFGLSYGVAQVPLMTLPGLTSITFHEQSGAIVPHTYSVNDIALTTHVPGQLNGTNRDFEGVANREFYDVYYSDADGSFNIDGGFVSIECRYDFTNGGGAHNINEVEFHFGSGNSIYGRYVASYVSNGSTYIPGSEEWAADCNLVTLSYMGNTVNTSIKLRLTIGILDPASTIMEESCSQSGLEVMVGNTIFNESNPIGTEVLTAGNGCDSLVYVEITFNEVYDEVVNYTGCSGDGYAILVGNTLYNESNPSGIEMLTTQANCDSTITVDLVFHPIYENEINYQGCEGDGYSVVVNGEVYRESNPDGTEIMMTAEGCDSMITINLAFAPVSFTDITYVGCSGDNYAVVVNGFTYDEANPEGMEYLFNQNGCDSIVTIDLTFNPVSIVDVTHTSCAGSGYAIVVNGTTYDESHPSGTEWMTGAQGCDSIIHIALSFVQETSQLVSYSGCSGDGYAVTVNGTIYNEANPTGQEILTASTGCDSIVDISLSYLSAITVSEFHTACMGSGFSLLVNGTVYNESHPSGVEVFTSQSGCDSIVNILIDFLPVESGAITYAGCSGDGYSVTVNGAIYDEQHPSGVEILTAHNGCDSIVTVDLSFEDLISILHTYTGCEGDGYAVVFNGNVYNEANPGGVEIIQGTTGCDTAVTIALTFLPMQHSTITYVGCNGDGYEVSVNGTLYNESHPQGSEVMTSQNGCDSVITISLSFLPVTQHAIQYAGCVGDHYSILVNGTVYNEMNPSGMEVMTGSNGCDSIVTVDLVFGNQFVTSENYSGCSGDGYFVIVNGTRYDEQHPAGTESIPGVTGCDTLVEIELAFAPASFSNIDYAGCSGDGYAMVINGTTYNEQHPDGAETLANVLGCDSVITIAMRFERVDSTNISYTGCIGDGYAVTVNGASYDESNPAGIEMMQNTHGCDSIIEVVLIYEDCTEEDQDCGIYIPNVISPNEDGINDAFGFSFGGSCEITGFRVSLFDRWGDEMYSSDDPSFKWKGDFKGEQLQPGVYVYLAEIYFMNMQGPVIRRGDVMLIR